MEKHTGSQRHEQHIKHIPKKEEGRFQRGRLEQLFYWGSLLSPRHEATGWFWPSSLFLHPLILDVSLQRLQKQFLYHLITPCCACQAALVASFLPKSIMGEWYWEVSRWLLWNYSRQNKCREGLRVSLAELCQSSQRGTMRVKAVNVNGVRLHLWHSGQTRAAVASAQTRGFGCPAGTLSRKIFSGC